MRFALLALAGLALTACVHTETVRPAPASTTVVTPPPASSTTVVRPGAY